MFSLLESRRTVLTATLDNAPVEIICNIFRHATRIPPLNCDDKSRSLFKQSLTALLALTASCRRWRVIVLADPTLWTILFADLMSPNLLLLHLQRSAGLPLEVIITNPHPIFHSILLNEAYRFRRLVVDDLIPYATWSISFPGVPRSLEELQIDGHRNPSPLGYPVLIFHDLLPNLHSLQLRDVSSWRMGMFKGLGHFKFLSRTPTIPLSIPLALDVLHASPLLETLSIEGYCDPPDPEYVCQVARLSNLRQLRVVSDAVSEFLHLIDVPPSTNIEIVRSLREVPGTDHNVLSCLHPGLPWINLLDGTRDLTISLGPNTMSVELRNCHGGVIVIEVNEISARGMDHDTPPQYASLLIHTFDAVSRLSSLKSTSSLSITISEGARKDTVYTAVDGFASSEWYNLLQHLENLKSLAVPLLGLSVIGFPLSFDMMCPSLREVAITMDIPADEVYEEHLRRVTDFVEARGDCGSPLSSLNVDVSVATPVPKVTRAEYIKTWSALVGDVTFFARSSRQGWRE